MPDDIHKIIHAKVVALARSTGANATKLGYDDKIPSVLDSASIMELIMWLETHFDTEIDQERLTMTNFGSVNAIVQTLKPAPT